MRPGDAAAAAAVSSLSSTSSAQERREEDPCSVAQIWGGERDWISRDAEGGKGSRYGRGGGKELSQRAGPERQPVAVDGGAGAATGVGHASTI